MFCGVLFVVEVNLGTIDVTGQQLHRDRTSSRMKGRYVHESFPK